MSNIVLRLGRRSVSDLLIFALSIHNHMVDAASVFASPPISMTDFLDSINALNKAHSNALNGSHNDFVIRNDLRKELENNLRILSNYVAIESKGEEEIIVLAGMSKKKTSVYKHVPLEKPVIKSMLSEYKGALTISWFPIANRVNFALEYTDDSTNVKWVDGVYSTSRKVTISGLKSDTRYWVRIRAIGKKGTTSDWSEPATRMVE